MAAAIQHAAGGALLGAASSPAAADFTCRAVAAAAPRLLGLMQQRHALSSAPRALHTLLHRPSSVPSATGASSRRRMFHSHVVHRPAGAIAGANKQIPAMMGASRSFSSHDKLMNQLQEEEASMKRKKAIAEALMNDLPTSNPGAKDHGVEIQGINHLFGLLDVADAATPTTTAIDADEQAARQVAELRSLVEKRKNALLIEILSNGDNREQKKAELVDAGRRLRDALVGHDERRAFQNLHAELMSLNKRVASSEYNYKSLSDKVAAGRMELESANANTHSLRADVSRVGYQVESAKQDAKEAQRTAESASTLPFFTFLEMVVVGCLRRQCQAAKGAAVVACKCLYGVRDAKRPPHTAKRQVARSWPIFASSCLDVNKPVRCAEGKVAINGGNTDGERPTQRMKIVVEVDVQDCPVASNISK